MAVVKMTAFLKSFTLMLETMAAREQDRVGMILLRRMHTLSAPDRAAAGGGTERRSTRGGGSPG